MAINIIGAGFGRTGTLSLKHALEQLGFDRCYHMMEVPSHDGGAEGWLRAARGEPLNWDTFLHGFQAAVDWPACAFWLELHQQYPDAKVILTVRDTDKWYASALETIWPFSSVFPRWALALVKPLRQIQNMIDTVIWQGTFGGRFLEPEHAKQVYRDHIDRVKSTVPPQQLLVYEVAQGWEPLCAFLGVPVPNMPFPNVNDAESMKRRIQVVRTVVTTLYTLLGGAMLALLYVLLS